MPWGAMSRYRLLILDERGTTVGAVEFESGDDEAAKGHAETVLGGSQCGELWRRIVPVEGNGHVRKPH